MGVKLNVILIDSRKSCMNFHVTFVSFIQMFKVKLITTIYPNMSSPVQNNTYRTPNKLEMHTCKLEVINPEYGSLYTKAWLDGNGCNAVFCRKLSQEIAILHSVKCVSTLKTCCSTPYTVSMKKDSTSSAEQNHTRDLSKVLQSNIKSIG